ncbi:MAG: glutamyl endopeptidase [Phenylobacterium sp.]|jgi:glutamyl endopeptidase
MKNFHKLLITAVTSALFISASAQAEQTGANTSSMNASQFTKLPGKASFIHGDNLIDGPVMYSNKVTSSVAQSLQDRAQGLKTVMVTRDGDQYEATIDAKDLAIFEKAINSLQQLGADKALFNSPGHLPTVMPERSNRRQVPGDTQGKVHGTDTRTQITNTVQNPYWYIGRIAIGCSGTLVGPKHVLTAGHCVADGSGNWHSSLNFSVGQDGSYKPWGSENWANAMTTSQWFNNKNAEYDYGMIILQEAPHGGWTGYGNYAGGTHSVTGYPGDKPTGQLWTDSSSTSSSARQIFYSMDTAGGQSGSGIADSGNTVRGIHAYGYSSNNGGTRITSTVYNQISSWISANP